MGCQEGLIADLAGLGEPQLPFGIERFVACRRCILIGVLFFLLGQLSEPLLFVECLLPRSALLFQLLGLGE